MGMLDNSPDGMAWLAGEKPAGEFGADEVRSIVLTGDSGDDQIRTLKDFAGAAGLKIEGPPTAFRASSEPQLQSGAEASRGKSKWAAKLERQQNPAEASR